MNGDDNIQDYCDDISKNAIQLISEMGGKIESTDFRGNHLFGVRLGDNFELDDLKKAFTEANIFISQRGSAIRISPHVFNTKFDFEKLVSCFEKAYIPKWV